MARKTRRRGPRKGITPPHLRRFLFKKGHKRTGRKRAR